MHFKFKICAPPAVVYLKPTKIAHQGISSLSNRQCSFESRNPIRKSDDFGRNQSKIRIDRYVENVFSVFATI